MKKIIYFFILIFASKSLMAQLQNPSFELWDSGDPVWWSTSNFYNPGSAIQTNDAHGGQFALAMSVVADSTGAAVAPYAINMYPLTTMPQVLTFWVKGSLAGNNKLNASFNLIELDTTINTLAYGDQSFVGLSNVYAYKFINILPLAGPSLLGQATIYFDITADVGSSLNLNSAVIIDDLYVGVDNTGFEEPKHNAGMIEKIFPNPAQDVAFLMFNKTAFGKVSLHVYDLLGNVVKEVINENMPDGKFKAEIDVSQLLQGVYICKLSSDGAEQVVKLVKQ